MRRPRTPAFALLVAFQVIVLVGGVLAEEAGRGGDEVVLQAVPVDPRDLLRGDYVVLAYEISTYGAETFGPGDVVFVELEPRGRVWEPIGVSTVRPGDGRTAIRGVVTSSGWIEFGIEAYFVPEGRGWEIETAADVEVVVSLAPDGRARIRHLLVDGRRWE